MFKDDLKFVGEFFIQQLDEDDNVISEYKDKNLIMDAARKNMAELIAGVANGKVINRFIIGSRGHVGSDILDPKVVGGAYPEGDFDTTRTALYSEEAVAGTPYWYVDFTPNVAGGAATVDAVYNEVNNSDTITDVVVDVTVNGKETVYTVTVPVTSANNINTDPVAYTEAGLVSVAGADVDLFSMKCFPARVKEDTVKLKIVWRIIF